MTDTKNTTPRPICWFEIPVKDTSRAKQFYSELFGWTYEEFKEFEPDYWTINTGEGSLLGGFVKTTNPINSEGSILFMHIDNIKECY